MHEVFPTSSKQIRKVTFNMPTLAESFDPNEGDTGGGQQRRTFAPLPAGEIMLAEVVDVEERDSFFWVDKEDESKGKQREINWKFRIVDPTYPEYAGRFVWGRTPTTFTTHENCKLRLWAEEVFGSKFDVGFDFDLPDLIGQDVRVVIGNETYFSKKLDKQVTKDFVDSLLRASAYEDSVNAF